MRDRLAERVRQFRATARPILCNGSVVVVLLMLTVGAVGAQTVTVYEGDFEDGTSQDWVTVGTAEVQPVNNEQMLFAGFSPDEANIPDTFNTSEPFRFEGRLYSTTADGYIQMYVGSQKVTEVQWANQVVQTPAQQEPADLSTNTYYNFSLFYESGEVKFLLEDNGWYNYTSQSESGDLSLQSDGWDVYLSEYKVSPNTSTFPEDGNGNGEEGDSELELDTRDYIMPNESAPYTVHFNDSGEWSEVTENATVTSNNTSVLAVNSVEHLLEGQAGVNTTVNVTAEYTDANGTVYNTTKQITVAQATVENLEILPTIWRFGATFGDNTIFFLIVATLTSVIGTRFTTAFGGLSMYWVVVMIGWFSGWVSVGIMMLTTIMCMFIGLNLAANIDYGAAGRLRR